MYVTRLRRMTPTLPTVPLGICKSHIPLGIAFHLGTGGGGGPIGVSLRGPPAEPGGARGPLDDVRESMAARNGAVAGHEMISAGQCWIHWMGEHLKCPDTTIR